MKKFKEFEDLRENKLTKIGGNDIVHIYQHDEKGTYHMTRIGGKHQRSGRKKIRVDDYDLQKDFESSKSKTVIDKHAKKAEKFWNPLGIQKKK